MNDILLIHGGSHGAWCWHPLMQELATLGWIGHAPDLPGGGADPTPRASVTLDSYVAKVNEVITELDLRDIILVGHSIAGMTLPEVIASNRERIHEAVYVAAFILDRGERGIDLVAPERQPDYYRLAEASVDRSLMLPYEIARQRFFNDLSEEEAKIAYGKLTPQPLAPYLEPASHGANEFASISRYIICQNDHNLPPDLCARYAEKLGGKVEEIDAGHDVMLSQPEELARMIVGG